MRRFSAFAALFVFLLVGTGAYGVAVDPPLDDPALEARAQEAFKSLRCLVCQNQSISDSNADLARDLRAIVRERIKAGDSDEETQDYLVQRYGDWVLLKPPFKGRTLLLWLGPLILFLIALGVAVGFYRGRPKSPPKAAPPLSAEEESRLAEIMRDGDGIPPT